MKNSNPERYLCAISKMLIVAFFPPFYFRLVVAHVGVESNNENVDHLRWILSIVRGKLTKQIISELNKLENVTYSPVHLNLSSSPIDLIIKFKHEH